MNTPSPLVPQGTKPPRGKSSLYFKILMILTVHVVLIGGMLLQGCKDTSKGDSNPASVSQSTPSDTTSPANPTPAPDTAVPSAVTTTTALSNQAMSTLPPTQGAPTPTTPSPTAATLPAPAPAPVTAGTGDYLIAPGDTMGAIARKNSVSLKALMDANPGVNPKKLQIGHKLQIPAGGATIASANPASGSSVSAAPVDAAIDGATYIVKSGDTLGRIARAHGTSYKKIMAVNDLKTTGIRVGQKLKMPAPKPAGAETIPAAASLSPANLPSPGPVSSVSTPATGIAN